MKTILCISFGIIIGAIASYLTFLEMNFSRALIQAKVDGMFQVIQTVCPLAAKPFLESPGLKK